MNKIYPFTFFFVFLFSCTEKMQENEVKELIEAESHSFHTDSDRSKFLDFWADTKDMRISYSSSDRTQNFVSVSELKAIVNKSLMPAANMAKSEYTNYAIRVSGTVAWAMFDQKATKPDGSVDLTHEFRCLEKTAGKWKIVGSSIHQYELK
jgi:hypothetical protein